MLTSSNASKTPLNFNSPGMIDASNILYNGIYEEQGVKLKNGQWTGKPFVKGGASIPTVGLIKNFTFVGDIDANGSAERVVFLWESSGGSGTRVYMAVLGIREGKSVNLSTHFLGDRVQLQMGRINQGKIELDVIQSGKDDAACCPTSKVLRIWSFKNKQLIESKPQVLGRFSLADLERVEWALTKMNWSQSVPENIKITMIIDNSKISGKSGCNRYFADIKEGKFPNEIIINQSGGTRMSCPGDIMELESRFIKALSNVSKYGFVNGQLAFTWKDDDAISTMLFTVQPIKSDD